MVKGGRIDSNRDNAGTISVTDDKVMEEIKKKSKGTNHWRVLRYLSGYICHDIYSLANVGQCGWYLCRHVPVSTIIGLVMQVYCLPAEVVLVGSHGSELRWAHAECQPWTAAETQH
jgi:hypothetical protein